jgi:hypothetical protein
MHSEENLPGLHAKNTSADQMTEERRPEELRTPSLLNELESCLCGQAQAGAHRP